MRKLFGILIFLVLFPFKASAVECVDVTSGSWALGLEDTYISSAGTCTFGTETKNPINQGNIPYAVTGLGAKFPNDLVDGGWDLTIKPLNIITKGPWFDVKAYGATGDGSTDDTTSIQAALDAANTVGGGSILVPTGHYKITKLTFSGNDITLQGLGDAIVSVNASANDEVFNALNRTNVWIKGFVINWNIAGIPEILFEFSGTTDSGIEDNIVNGNSGITALETCFKTDTSGSPKRVTIHNNRFLNINADVIRPASCTGVIVTNNFIDGVLLRDSVFPNRAIIAGSSTDVVISNNVIKNVTGGVGGGKMTYAIDIGGADNVVISGNVMNNVWGGIDMENGTSNVSIVGNTLIGLGATAPLYGQFGIWMNVLTVDNVEIANNRIESFQDGMRLQGTKIVVIGNTVSDCYFRGIFGSQTGESLYDIIIIGNTVTDCSKVAADTWQGISIHQDEAICNGGIIAGNLITGSHSAGISVSVISPATVPIIVINNNSPDAGYAFTGNTQFHKNISLNNPIPLESPFSIENLQWDWEFLDNAAALASTDLSQFYWTGGGANGTQAVVEAGGGTCNLATDTANDDSSSILYAQDSLNIDKNPRIEIRVQLGTITTAYLFIGIVDAAFTDKGTMPSDYAGIEFDTDVDAANLYMVTDDTGAGEVKLDTAVDLLAGTYIKVLIDLTDTENPEFYIDDIRVTGAFAGTVKDSQVVYPFVQVQSLAGAAARTGVVDYVKMWADR